MSGGSAAQARDQDDGEGSPKAMRRRTATEQAIRDRVRARFGLWPLYEARNRLMNLPHLVRWRVFEEREVRRLAASVDLPFATVAVVIPTFRRSAGVKRAVESVLAQTRTDFVVVVVDDGGGDIGEVPDDDRVRVVSLARNTAVLGVVRNVGIRLTRSTYIAFLDDDNTWLPRHLESCVSALGHTAVPLVYSSVERVLPDGRRLDVLAREFDRRALADDSFVDASSIVVRRSVRPRFSRIRRTRKMLPQEDWEFVYRTSRRGGAAHVDDVTVSYLVNPSSYYTDWADDVARPVDPLA